MKQKRVLIDVTGQTFNKLTVVKRAGTNKFGMATWHCICACGKTTTATGAGLRRGSKTSCGCAFRANQKNIGKHGAAGARAREERKWAEMA